MNELMNKLVGKELVNNFHGQGIVKSVESDSNSRIYINVLYGTKGLKIRVRSDLESVWTDKTIKFVNTEDNDIADKLSQLVSKNNTNVDVIKCRSWVKEYNEKQEAKKRHDEIEKAKRTAISYEKSKESAIQKFKEMLQTSPTISGSVEEFYVALGWLSINIRTVFARLPDYLDGVFTAHFGADTPRTKVDTSKKTINGFKRQWTYSFSASLKNIDTAPAIIVNRLNNKDKLADTAFIWTLIDNHNFKFGKKQDLDKIVKTIPDNMMTWFELGQSIKVD